MHPVRTSCLLILLLNSITVLEAQNPYEAGIGLRLGNHIGATGKIFLWNNQALEGIVAGRGRGLDIHVLWEKYEHPFDLEGLYLYYGAGGHISFHDHLPTESGGRNAKTFGFDGILGLEYLLPLHFPLSVSLDWKPEINLSGYSGLDFGQGGVSLRYLFH